jgi:hypothetical protein
MRLPTLSPATRRVGRTTASARRGAVHPSVCNIPCGPGYICPADCTCECDPSTVTKYDPKHTGFVTHVGCMCVGGQQGGGGGGGTAKKP